MKFKVPNIAQQMLLDQQIREERFRRMQRVLHGNTNITISLRSLDLSSSTEILKTLLTSYIPDDKPVSAIASYVEDAITDSNQATEVAPTEPSAPEVVDYSDIPALEEDLPEDTRQHFQNNEIKSYF